MRTMASTAAVAMAFVVAGGAAVNAGTPQPREVSWWWSSSPTECAMSPGGCPQVAALLEFVREHPRIVHTLIMRCGIVTCCRENCGDCAPSGDRDGSSSFVGAANGAACNRTACVNNGGVGGTVTGSLSPACALAIPPLRALGVKIELWLGEDDSLESARYLFAHADQTAAALAAVAEKHPDITGFNVDLEAGGGTPEDAVAFASFLGAVTSRLNAHPSGPLRFSADVACGDAGDIASRPVASNCTLLGRSGANRVMNMATYNAGGLESWLYALSAALDAPLGTLGVGLGCWVDSRTNGTWSVTPESAEQRVCALMNHSVQEVDMFDLAPEKGFPEPFWIAQLERFVAGGGCQFVPPPPITCPQPSSAWHPGGGPEGCCESSANRGPTHPSCDVKCAQAECAAAKMHWRPENYSVHPYTCCSSAAP